MKNNAITPKTPPTPLYRSKLFTTLLCCLAIIACDDDPSGGVRGTTANDDLPDTSAYLFYLSEQSLMAVDPADPSNPIAVEPAGAVVTGAVVIPYLFIDNVTGQPIAWKTHTAIYAKDGRLWKVSALKHGNLLPIQISNETGATTICQASGWYDIDPNQVNYNYQLPGEDQICGFTDSADSAADNVRKVVNVGMTENDNPKLRLSSRVFGRPLGTEGVIKKFYVGDTLVSQLAVKGSDLIWCDADCSPASVTIVKTGVTKAVSIAMLKQDDVFLNIDGNVHLYKNNTISLGEVLHAGPSDSLYNVQIDASNRSDLYLFSNKGIYRLPSDGTAASTLLVAETDTNAVVVPIRFTSNRIVYRLNDSLGVAVKSAPKTGGTAIELYRDVALRVLRVFVVDELVYYSSMNMVSAPSEIAANAGIIKTDGTGHIELGDALWSGYAWRTPNRSLQIASLQIANPQMHPHLFLASDLNANGRYLSTYDAVTGSKVAELGQLPQSTVIPLRLEVTTSDNNTLITLNNGNSADIFFLNTEIAGSLERITDNAIDESLVRSSWFNP